MTKYTIGIDPGINGAIALCKDGNLIDVWDMPIRQSKSWKGNEIDPDGFVWLMDMIINEEVYPNYGLTDYDDSGDLVWYSEDALTIGGQGNIPAKQNRLVGVLIGCVTARNYELNLVNPYHWREAFGWKRIGFKKGTAKAQREKEKKAHKDKLMSLAIKLFPEHHELFKRKKDIDRAEAALIARYGYEQSK